jgi:hypothetical protein
MLANKKKFSKWGSNLGGYTLTIFTAPVLAVTGLWAGVQPIQAITYSYRNDYRACAAQLLKVGVTPEAAAKNCATALRPRELSACVVTIRKETQITPIDALSACNQARRPEELSQCVVAISKVTQQTANPAALTYCGRSLLPISFAQCVVGLRQEIALNPTQALDTCIDASDRSSGVGSVSTTPPGLNPIPGSTPIPSTPNSR